MRTLSFTAAKGGINRLRTRGNAKAENFYDLVNAYVTGSGTVVPREGTIRDTILPSTTRGLTAFEGVLHTFSSQLELYTPVGYLANVLSHPTDPDATLVEIHFAQPFMGALYVVAEWSDGGIYHYWLSSSGEWAAETIYFDGDVVTPTTPNGLLYKAVADNPDAPTETWRPSTNYDVGHKVLPTVYNGYYFEVLSTEGDMPVSGSTEPAWNISTEGAHTVESAAGTEAPSSSTSDIGVPQPPPAVADRYGTGSTALSAESAAAVAASDTIPLWLPGTLYSPGDLVKPRSVAPVVNSAIPNAGFESGDTGWTKGTGWHITNVSIPGNRGHYPYQGSYYAYWQESEVVNTAWHYLSMTTTVPVVPGQFLSASCFDSRAGGTNSGCDGQLVMLWYDAYDVLIKETLGTFSDAHDSKAYRAFTVQDSTPGEATQVKVAYKARVSSIIPSQGGRIAIDSFAWDYVNLTPVTADFTVYQAVQAAAATSGTTEPVWPGAGLTVVDGGVTWLGGVTSVITWSAVPIMKSGTTEPDWEDQVGSSTDDNTINWEATTGLVEEAPNSAIVSIAAKKIFAGDTDIEKYSATVNPLDWTTAEDAGYLPTGLNTHGANPIRATGLYRGNLVVFNSAGLQVWQIDEDPELMSLLDAVPVGSTYHRALQPVKNDLVFLTNLGYRNLAIAGASTNLQSGDFGDPIDPLVIPKIKAGTYTPKSLFYPARGQYWGWFGPDVFVATLNDEGRSWSRYVFPEAITDATLLDNDLYLRTSTHKVWKVNEDTLVDDYIEPVAPVLEVSQDDENDPVVLVWSAAVMYEELPEGYDIYVSVNGSAFSLLATVANNALTYDDVTVYEDDDVLLYYVSATRNYDTALDSNQDGLTYSGGVPVEPTGTITAGTYAPESVVGFALDDNFWVGPGMGSIFHNLAPGYEGTAGLMDCPNAFPSNGHILEGVVYCIYDGGGAPPDNAYTSIEINGTVLLMADATETWELFGTARFWKWAASSFNMVDGVTYDVWVTP